MPARGPPQRRPAQALLQRVEVRVDHGCHVQGDELRERQAADHRDPERAARFRADAHAERNGEGDRKSTRLNSSHLVISYAVFCLKKKTSLDSPIGLIVTTRTIT